MSAANYTRVWQIQSVLHPRPDDLVSTQRFFVREGELLMWNEKKRKKTPRYFFLFNDVLLITKRESHKSYWLRVHITLRSQSVNVEEPESSSNTNEFRLHCRARTFILFAANEDYRKDWIDDVRASIAGSHKDEVANKESKKKSEELLMKKNDLGKVVAPTLSQAGKKPKKIEEEDEDEDEEEEAKPRPKKTRSKKPQSQPQLLGDVIEYPSLPYTSSTGGFENPFMSGGVRPGTGFVQSSPGTFNTGGGNPFLSGGGGQPANPFAPQQPAAPLALTYSNPGFSSQFGYQPQQPANPFASASTAAYPFVSSSPATFGGQPNAFATNPAPFGGGATSFGGNAPNPFASQPTAAANPFALQPQAQTRPVNPFM